MQALQSWQHRTISQLTGHNSMQEFQQYKHSKAYKPIGPMMHTHTHCTQQIMSAYVIISVNRILDRVQIGQAIQTDHLHHASIPNTSM